MNSVQTISQKGYYVDSYQYKLIPFEGLDYAKKVFVFSGQGSSYPGMMKDLFSKSPIIQMQFQRADKFLILKGYKPITDYILNNAAEEKNARTVSEKNIALLTLQVGVFGLLNSLNIKPEILTGHSFGEYGALVCSGILNFEDALDILTHRDKEEFFDSLGEMLAVRCSYEEVLKVQKTNDLFYISNINSPNQIVISALPQNVAQVIRLFKAVSVPCIRLNIKFPYHCELMGPALEEFRKFIDQSKYKFNEPLTPVLSSVDRKTITKNNYLQVDFKSLIKDQMYYSVNFLEQIQILKKKKFFNYIEIGPGRVLTDFIKDMDSNDRILKNRMTQDMLPSTLKTKVDDTVKSSGKFLPLFNKALNFVTGYEIDKFSVKDRMQEDLGIDSIRKAEIIFKVLDESGIKNSSKNQSIRISDLSTVDDILQYFEHQYKSSLVDETEQTLEFSNEYKFMQPKWIYSKLSSFVQQLDFEQAFLELNYKDSVKAAIQRESIVQFIKTPGNQRKLIQIHIQPDFTLNMDTLLKHASRVDVWVKDFVNFLAELKISDLVLQKDIFFQFIFKSDSRSTDYRMSKLLRAFIKSWSLEILGVGCQIIDLLDTPNENCQQEIMLNHLDSSAIYIRYLNGQRQTEVLVSESEKQQTAIKLVRDTNVVILGGHSGIGWEIVNSIDPGLNVKIFLVGRRSEFDPFVQQKLLLLKEKNISAFYTSCDTRDHKMFMSYIESIVSKHGDISLLINAVGIILNQMLSESVEADRFAQFETKAKTVENLVYVYKKYNIQNIISFSSSTGYYWNAGQAVYALANSYVDVVSEIVDKSISGRRFQSVGWPPWDNVGVITDESPIQAFINFTGVTYLKSAQGVDFFWSALSSANSNIVILDENSSIRYFAGGVDKKSFRQFFSSIQTPFVGTHLNLTGLTLLNLPYLRDHCLSGRPIVAASNMIALFMQLGYVIWGKVPEAVGFTGHNFIFVDETASQVGIEFQRTPVEIAMKLKTSFVHSEGKVLKTQANLATVRKVIPKYSHKLDSAGLRGTVIETIRSFEYTDLFYVDPLTKHLLIEFNLSRLPRCTEMPLYDRLFAMIEICNQAVGLVGQWVTDQYSIPKSIASVKVYDDVDLTEKMYSQQENLRVEKDYVMADAYITNDSGEVVMFLTDIKFANLNQVANVSERYKVLKI